jgi:hypothetical protein
MSQLPLFDWPDSVDRAAVVAFLLLATGLPALGYAFFVLDVRAYLRSLRRQLVRLTGRHGNVPAWALPVVPACLEAFGLRLPCTEDELKAAYREQVKQMHPDRGGDRRRFLKLQQHFEESLALVRETDTPSERLNQYSSCHAPSGERRG